MYQRILLPIDGSPLSRAAALDGIEVARCFGAQAHGLYVMEPYQSVITYPGVLPAAYPSKARYEAQARQEAESKLLALAGAAHAAGVEWKHSVVFSTTVAAAIIACAKRNKCDLIVMGSHGRRGVDKLLLGSVASAVLAKCHIPVLVHRAARRLKVSRRIVSATPSAQAAQAEERHTW